MDPRSVSATRAFALVLALALVVLSMSPAGAYPRPGRTERVSVASDGTEADDSSTRPAISADGRYVAFASTATNLVEGDTNDAQDVFVHDRETGTTERVSVASDGTQAVGWSGQASISADGRHVAFSSLASNLVAGGTSGQHVFAHDRTTGRTEQVSMASDGTSANAAAGVPAISADGSSVAFMSYATNLAPAITNSALDVFVHDRDTGTTERVSVADDGAEADRPTVPTVSWPLTSETPSISADGRYVSFLSNASNLVPGDTNGAWDVFVRDRVEVRTERVSVAYDGSEANGHSFEASMSADGRYVAFFSLASNLVPGDTNDNYDVFVRDRVAGTTERVSVSSDGEQWDDDYTDFPTISPDGRYVAFGRDAACIAIVLCLSGGRRQVLVHDRKTRTTEPASLSSEGAVGDRASGLFPVVSSGGRYVAFGSSARNLVPDDTNGHRDVFVRDRGPSVGVGDFTLTRDADSVSVSGWATFAGQEVTAATGDDGLPGAEQLGADLTGAGLIYRPEQEDLHVRLGLASLPYLAAAGCGDFSFYLRCDGASTGAGTPAVVYGLSFGLGEVRYEVRALRATVGGAAPHLALYRCDPDCTEQSSLSGGIGTTGPEVVASVPLADLGAQEGADLGEVRGFAALGEAGTGSLAVLDEVDLPDGTIPDTRVHLGVSPAGTAAQEVDFSITAPMVDGVFSGTIDASSLPAGDYDVWARACLGEVCDATVRTLIRP